MRAGQMLVEDEEPKARLQPVSMAAVVVVWMFYLFLIYLVNSGGNGGVDTYVYYLAGQSVRAGDPIYNPAGVTIGQHEYLYPPLIALILSPFSHLNFQTFVYLWTTVNLLILIGTLAALHPYVPARLKVWLWLAPIFFTPMFETLWYGQVTLILLALIGLAWISVHRNRPEWAGVFLAVAAWVKVYPALMILYFVWQRNWRVLWGVLAAGFLMLVIQIAGVGWSQFWFYMTELLPELHAEGQIALTHSNQSVYGFAMRLFGNVPFVKPIMAHEALLNLTRWGILAFLTGVTGWLTWRRTAGGRLFDLQYGLVLLFSLVFGSSLNHYAIVPALLGYFLLVHCLSERFRFLVITTSVVSYCLITLHFMIIRSGIIDYGDRSQHTPAWVFSGPFVGLMLIWAMLAVLCYREIVEDL